MPSPIEKVVVTGAKGVIGEVLVEGLKSDFKITPVDLPDYDLRECSDVLVALKDYDAVVHLAWNKRDASGRGIDDSDVETMDPFNMPMALNVYQAAKELGLKRVIMASSGCADDFLHWTGPGLMRTDTVPTPFRPYGASKIWVESTGRYFARYHNLEVVCLRFGAIRKNNLAPAGEEHVWLSHEDCVGVVRAALIADKVPDNFTAFYAVSDNPGRIHDLTNPFNWKPK